MTNNLTSEQARREQRGETDGILQNLFFERKWMVFILYFSTEELKRQYSRTVLGPFWVVLTQFVVVFAIAFVYATVFNMPYDTFFPHLSASVICWNLISNTLIGAPAILVNHGATIKAFPMPTSVYVGQQLGRQLVQFVHALAIHVLVIIMFKVPVNLNTLLFPVMLGLVGLWLYGMCVFLAAAGARFRDIIPALNSFMYVMFLCTPVLWPTSMVPAARAYIVEWNPFFYVLDALRAPLLGVPLHANTWIVLFGMIALAWGLAFLAAYKMRRNAVFWV